MLNLSSTHTVADQVGTQTTLFSTGASARRHWIIIAVLAGLAALSTVGLLVWDNPLPLSADDLWLIAHRRPDAVIAMIVVAYCHTVATVTFQSIANSRIIIPSITGLEALHVAISTVAVYSFGVTGLMTANSVGVFVLQSVLMAGLSLVLYAQLLTGQGADMHSMLLVGTVTGGGPASLSTFMQCMLTPLDFDPLTARLLGSVDNVDPEFFPVAISLAIVAIVVTTLHSWVLDVMPLGCEVATNLGVNYQVRSITVPVAVVVLMAVSTAMIGPMTSPGFLVVTITYQATDTYDYRFVLPMVALIGYVTLASVYFISNHVFYAQSVVSTIIELVGGSIFLYVVLKKERL